MASDISIIIPVFNRPSELEELLGSLEKQTTKTFDVIVVEDGSEQRSEKVIEQFKNELSIQYFYKLNSGPGDSRNFGCKKSEADFFIFFDSDCIIPPEYMKNLQGKIHDLDAFGGPDRAHPDFSPIQQAISYSMTSIFTTGGIRGNKKSAEKFHPRSFNMGYSRKVFEKTGGFSDLRFGEDIDLSIRIFEEGFKAILIPECYVYHKRRTDFVKFFRQVYNSGIARINLFKRHPKSLRILHFFPAVFVLYQVLSIPHAIYHHDLWVLWPTVFYLFLILIHASIKTRDVWTSFLSVWASVVQLFGYGLGFMKGIFYRILLKKPEFHAFNKSFYK